jgi:hypothetical protein
MLFSINWGEMLPISSIKSNNFSGEIQLNSQIKHIAEEFQTTFTIQFSSSQI